MDITYEDRFSLGLGKYDELGFNSQEELDHELSMLIKVRSEFKSKSKVISI